MLSPSQLQRLQLDLQALSISDQMLKPFLLHSWIVVKFIRAMPHLHSKPKSLKVER